VALVARGTQPTKDIPLKESGLKSIDAPIASDNSVMLLGDYKANATSGLVVVNATSKDNSFMLGGHWGGSGQHTHVNPKSSGHSLMILGNVNGDSTVREVEQVFQRRG
jgi:hypothetical protein